MLRTPLLRAIRFGIAPIVIAALAAATSLTGPDKPQIVEAGGPPCSQPPCGTTPPGQDEEHTGPLTANEQARFNRVMEQITPLGDISEHQDELADLGLYIVSDVNDVQPVSSVADDMTLPRPQVLWDTSNQRYYAYASYEWNTGNPDRSEWHYYDIGSFSSSCIDTPCDIGGADGFGMRFSRNMQNVQVSAIFCRRGDTSRSYARFNCTTPINPEDHSSAGVSWRKQDKIYKTVTKPDNNMFQASTSMVIKRPACGAPLQIYSRYGHSWSGTAPTGFSVGVDSFGLSWSNSNNHWAASSQSGTWDIWDPC
ncbi:hypothetical protein [Nocardioides sp. URHA0032]|uniref:hypothetical protein n=1 Tax=Nocardioides sp. URHA0032 TaxID=1380388 RepID=UPI000491F309|nr:hypothetical protein [Nocardioides sp. URHA0032]